uniref:Dachshund 1 n=1 Tax=Echinostoma caproni TaxID=27848 RepID=A0A183AW80_9TREM
LLAEAANVASSTPATNLSVNQIVAQLRHALQLAHSTTRLADKDNGTASISSQPTSPRLTKALAQILAQGGLDGAGTRRSRDQSPISLNAIPMTALSTRHKYSSGSVRSEDSIGPNMPTYIFWFCPVGAQFSSLTDVKSSSTPPAATPLVPELAHTGSTGYVSGTTGLSQHDHSSSSVTKPLNPFGDSSTDDEGETANRTLADSRDPGLGSMPSSKSAQKHEPYRTPFDE